MPSYVNPKFVHVEPRGGKGGSVLAALAALVAVAAGVYWLLADTVFLAVAISVVSVLCVAGTVRIVYELRHPSMGPVGLPARPLKEAVLVQLPALPAAEPLAIEAPRPVLSGVVLRKDDERETQGSPRVVRATADRAG